MRLTIIALAAFAGLSAAVPSNAESWDDVVAAAKKEGGVTVYSGFPGAPEPKEIFKKFEAKFGISVKLLEARTAEIQERIRTEVATNHSIADVSLNGGNSHYGMRKMGLLQEAGVLPNLSHLTVKGDAPDEVPIFLSSYAIAINTRLVPPADEPKSWLDITDPKWKGKILADDPTSPGGASTWFSVLVDKLGEDFHRKLALQNLTFSKTIRENPKRIARGEFPIYIPLVVTDLAPLDGLPIKGIVPKEGLPYSSFSVVMIKNAGHPNAARLLMNYFLEPESQLVYANGGYPVTTAGVGEMVPQKLRWMVDAPLLGRQDPDRRDANLELAKKIYYPK